MGKGSYGKVRLGVHRVTGERVAVKLLNVAGNCSSGLKQTPLDALQAEIDIMQKVTHDNVVNFREVMHDQPYKKKNGIRVQYTAIVLDLCPHGEV